MPTSIFVGDSDFCPECGTILPLPQQQRTVTCYACAFVVNVKVFDKMTTEYEIKYNNESKFKRLKEDQGRKEDIGPMVSRDCFKCGHQGMSYATLQTRSADEGQTVFYSCPQCKNQEFENS